MTVPTGTTDGDLLVAVGSSDWGSFSGNGLPPGFTALTVSDYDGGGNSVHLALGWRVASSEPASYTFPNNNSDNVSALLRITGAEATFVQVAPAAAGGGSTSFTAPSLTPSGGDDLLLCIFVCDPSSSSATTW
ncbi:MAG: hypothetical protein ACRDQA_15765, partial [Nocardioidaceae bacterium]